MQDTTKDAFRLTVLGTTDLHGNVLNWDYFKDAEYDDARHNDVGLAKISTLINSVRADHGVCSTLTLDAGDTIQGTPLSYFYTKVDPITAEPASGDQNNGAPMHPMAVAMNAIGYDAAALGNHEFNYGLPHLHKFQSQLNHPLLGANALDWSSDEAAFPPYTIKSVPLGDSHAHQGHSRGHQHEQGDEIKVGIVGLVTPGCAIWDKANVDGQIRFNGIVEQAEIVIPQLKQAGADIIIVCCHSGATTSSSYGNALPWPENASTLLAQQVADIDAILVGHAHSEIPEHFVLNGTTGQRVLISEPLSWGMRLTVMELDLVKHLGKWRVSAAHSHLLDANTVAEDTKIAQLVMDQHTRVRSYVNSVIGASGSAMSAATSRFEGTPAIDFINHVQADTVKSALTGSAYGNLPVLSVTSPAKSDAGIPAGEVTIRDVAGLYVFDNTLLGIIFNGDQVRTYLEHSADYFRQISGTGPFDPPTVTNAVTPLAPNGTPNYNYDIMGGLDASLSYDIDIAEPPGYRIKHLTYGGAPIMASQQFVVAVNNYRQSGGGNFPEVTTARVVYDRQDEIRQLIIDWVSATKSIDPAAISASNWKLVSGGTPVVINGSRQN
jgi:2',3'-cyclic-nucleotide 2'-phosphodiesterase/3'-nucleotidase